ncbi:MAG: NADH-quinone oxidoreductase subunit NuoE [Rhizobiaceae bacterium]|nr:NADH-quinone oxidoreductase subunit NuoE [Rhizobiaceae bacterium]
MSVRRLADPQFQPPAFAFTGENLDWAEKTIQKYPAGREQSAVIPLLMRAQEQDGWVTRAAIEHIAQMLEMPLIRVLEVATFYTQFQLKPVGTRAHIQVCGTTPCMLRGSEALMDVCRSKIHHDQFHLNEGGTLSWEEVECQGACVNAPMVMIFKDAYEDLTPERLGEIIDEFDAGRGEAVPTGPQIDRVFSAPESGFTSLADEKAVLKANRKAEPRKSGGDQPEVAPSQAAKPKTAAPETDPSIKSPSPVKADQAAEKAASVEAPKGDKAAADRAEPTVEGEAKPRAHAKKKDGTTADYRAPEDMEGEPIGPAGRRRKSETKAEPGKPSPEGTAEVKKPVRAKKPNTGDEGGDK